MRPCRPLAALAPTVLIAALSGCASTPLPTLSPPLPVQWRHAAAAEAPAVDLRGWWHAFHDSRLDALVDTALRDNLDVAQAHERLLAARELASHADARYLPEVRAKTEDAIDPDASASFFVAGFDSVWELPLFGRGTASGRQVRGNLDAATADLQLARVSLVAEVVRDWLQLQAAQHKTTPLQAIVDTRRQQLALQQVRRKLQLASPADVVRAEATLAQARGDLAGPRHAVDANATALAALLGRTAPDPQWLTPGPWPELGRWQLTSTPADLLRSRPEIARAQAGVLSAAGDAGMARAERFPSIGIGGSIVWSTNLATHRSTNDNALASAGPIIDIPLFDWGLRRAQAHAKQHELKAAVFAYRQAVLDGVAEVENALGRLEQQRQQERQADLAMHALEQADAATAKRAQLGLDNPLDRLDSAAASDQAQLAAIDARTARGLAFVSLYKTLGGAPLPDDVNAQASTQDWR